jgi:HEAT repeat protein
MIKTSMTSGAGRSPTTVCLLLLVLLTGVQCAGRKPKAPWPPSGDPTFGGIYPYDFSGSGAEKIRDLKRLLSANKYDKENEDLYLFAYGRSLLDGLLYASLLQPAARKKFLKDLGSVLDLPEMETLEQAYENKEFFKEPFFVLAKKYPKSPYGAAAVELNRILAVLTDEQPSWLSVEPSFNFAPTGQVLSLGYERDVAFSIRILRTFEAAADGAPGERVPMIIRALLPCAFPNPEIGSSPQLIFGEKNLEKFIFRVMKPVASKIHEESDPMTFALKVIVEWMHGKLYPAMNSEDPLTPDIKHMLVARSKLIRNLPLHSQVAQTLPIPESDGSADAAPDRFYPFVFVTVDAEAGARVAMEPILAAGPDGKAKLLNSGIPTLWPGKLVVKDAASPSGEEGKSLMQALERAEKKIAAVVSEDYYENVRQGRTVALAVDQSLNVRKIEPLLGLLRTRYDSVLLTASTGDHLAFIPAEIRPNCPGEGSRITVVLEDGGIRLVDTSDDEKREKQVDPPFGASPVKPDVIASVLTSFADMERPVFYLETSYRGGKWTWSDLVSLHGKVTAALREAAPTSAVYVYLLPEISMEEARAMETLDITLPDDPAGGSMEALILKGLAGDFDEKELDAALGGYLKDMKLEDAAAVILNAARCWGGDYRERASEALSKAEPDILAVIADYLGDESIGDVAGAALSAAGKAASTIVAGKLRSSDEAIWTAAWYVLSAMPFKTVEKDLARLLEDPSPEIRMRGLKLLAQIGPADGMPAVLDLMDDEDEFVRRWAVVDAGMLGMTEAVDKLLHIARTEKDDVELLADAIFALGLLEAQEAGDMILDFAAHSEAAVRAAAALALGNMAMSDEDALAVLFGLLEDTDPSVRANAASALTIIGDPQAIPYLEPLLEDPAADVRDAADAALSALGKAAEGSASMDLSDIAETCSDLPPETVLEIASEGGDEVFDCLAKLTLSKDPAVRLAAVEALGLRGDVKAEKVLVKRTKDKSKDVRKAAWTALKSLGLTTVKKGKKP